LTGCLEAFLGGMGTGDGDGDSSSSTSTSTTSSTGMGEGTGDETDTGTKFDVGPECGNGILEPGEQCDEGDDNSDDYPAPCGLECFWNIS